MFLLCGLLDFRKNGKKARPAATVGGQGNCIEGMMDVKGHPALIMLICIRWCKIFPGVTFDGAKVSEVNLSSCDLKPECQERGAKVQNTIESGADRGS